MSSFGLLDALADLDFLLAGEQRHLAHLVHVHPHRVVQDLQPGVFLFFRFRRLGALDFGVVNDLDVEVAQLGIELIQILRRQTVGQDVVDVVVGDVAVLVRQVQQRLDGLSQVRCLTTPPARRCRMGVRVCRLGLGRRVRFGFGLGEIWRT